MGRTLLIAAGIVAMAAVLVAALGAASKGSWRSRLDLYCWMGGFWHRGKHYDIRRSDTGREAYFGRADVPSEGRREK